MNYKIISLLTISLLLIVFIAWSFFNRPLLVQDLPVTFSIGKYNAFNLTREQQLSFGMVTPGGLAVRDISIINNNSYEVEVKAFADKNIADYIEIKQPLILEAEEIRNVSVAVRAPENAFYGDFSGKLRLIFVKA